MLICLVFFLYINNLLLDKHNYILEQFFIMIHVFVVNKMSSNAIVDYKDY